MAAPATCSMALKEWATVLEATARGEQFVLIRKGGLIEPGSGFEVISPSFVFYPTFEHQAVKYLRAPYQGYFEAASRTRAPEGRVAFQLFGQAVHSVQSMDSSMIERLSPFHIYNEDFFTQRLKWQPDQPLAVVIIRAFKITPPVTLSAAAQYAGCKSWVELEAPVSLGQLTPIVDDATFAKKRIEIEAVLETK